MREREEKTRAVCFCDTLAPASVVAAADRSICMDVISPPQSGPASAFQCFVSGPQNVTNKSSAIR